MGGEGEGGGEGVAEMHCQIWKVHLKSQEEQNDVNFSFVAPSSVGHYA